MSAIRTSSRVLANILNCPLIALTLVFGFVSVGSAQGAVLDQVKAQFNGDSGSFRLVVLMSPTCPACVGGAGWIEEYVMRRNPELGLRVYAVWYSMLGSDSPEAFPAAQEFLSDSRVTHYWDEPKDVGRWYLDVVPTGYKGRIQWDAFYLYSDDSVWDDEPTDLLAWGRTILDDRRKLTEALGSLDGSSASNEDE